MTLAETLLQKLAKWRPDSDRQTLDVTHPESGWAASLQAGPIEALGCRLWELTVKPSQPATHVDLTARAEQVAGRVTGLLEPLRVVEVDANQGLAQLRSDQPGHWENGQFYYEILLHTDGTSQVRRYQAPEKDQPRRQQVAFTLTHEALAKLVTDLTHP
jgi:hypothetical protein